MPLSRLSRSCSRDRCGAATVLTQPDWASAPLALELRRHDPDRFRTVLFAAPEHRAALIALYAFNFEIARIREVTREPLLGRIRLQWWRDVLAELYGGAAPRRHVVVEALAEALRDRKLSRPSFEALIDARELDLSDHPPPTLDALETYAEDSSASLVMLALEAQGAANALTRAAGRAVGIAYALAGLLAAVPFHARMKRVLLPEDLIERYGLDLQRSLFELKSSAALNGIVVEIAARAQTHLAAAGASRPRIARNAVPALLPAVIARHRLKLITRLGGDVFDPRWSRPDPLQSWRLAWKAWRGRY